jgi:hypothetical protein
LETTEKDAFDVGQSNALPFGEARLRLFIWDCGRPGRWAGERAIGGGWQRLTDDASDGLPSLTERTTLLPTLIQAQRKGFLFSHAETRVLQI